MRDDAGIGQPARPAGYLMRPGGKQANVASAIDIELFA